MKASFTVTLGVATLTLVALTGCGAAPMEDSSTDEEFTEEEVEYDYQDYRPGEVDQEIDLSWTAIEVPDWDGTVFFACKGVHGFYAYNGLLEIIREDPECVR